MTTGEGVSTLEHLAKMDRLLRDIQVELDPEREPPPALVVATPATDDAPDYGESSVGVGLGEGVGDRAGVGVGHGDGEGERESIATAPPPAPPPEPTPQLQALGQLAARLLASMRELLDGYEQFLVQIPSVNLPAPGRPRAVTRQPPVAGRAVPDVTVAAGPFASLDALRAFEGAVARLPGVREVAVRGYEGADRAIIEVRLERTGASHPSRHRSP